MTSHAGTISLIAQAFRQLGLTLPKPYVKGLADLAADRDRLDALPIFDPAALADAVLAALKAGKDPADSDDVQRHLSVQQLQVTNARNVTSDRLDSLTVELLKKHADGIHAAMAEMLAKVDATLAEAREVLPAGIDLSNPASGGAIAPDDLPIWGKARASLVHVDRIAQAWKVLASVTASTNAGHDEPLIVAALSASERQALGSRPKASDAALAGHRLSLATVDEFAERKLNVATDKQAALDAEPTFADSYRRTRGTGQVFTRP